MKPKTIEWCGYEWTNTMEGGRLIHPDNPLQYYDLENTVTLNKSNVLKLELKEIPQQVTHWDGKTYFPSYAAPTLRSVKAFTYGKFSVECMIPKGNGIWPAIWLSGEKKWPPEIDIMEGWPDGGYFRMLSPKFPYVLPNYLVTTNVHYRRLSDDLKREIKAKRVYAFEMDDPSEKFVKYSCEWLPDSITIRYDGIIVRKVTDRKVLDYINKYPEMYFIMNLWTIRNSPHIRQDGKMELRNFKYKAYEI